MGPRPSDRGRPAAPWGWPVCRYRASMGPRPSDRGRPQGETEFGRGGHASMGPRPSDRGRLEQAFKKFLLEHMASMGPRPSDRGRHLGYGNIFAQLGYASMGPRPSDRGRLPGREGGNVATAKLQWVHGLLTVGDLCSMILCCAYDFVLQWVHGLLTVGDKTNTVSA